MERGRELKPAPLLPKEFMSIDLTVLDQDMQSIMADLSEQVEWFTGQPPVTQGSFAAMCGEQHHGHKLEDVGILGEYALEVVFRTAQFTGARPNTGDIFKRASGLRFRAVNTHLSADGVQLLFMCEALINAQ
jgi:hypothetical protein